MKILLIGNGAREHCIAETFKKNPDNKIFSYIKSKNPGIVSLSEEFVLGDYSDLGKIEIFAKKIKPDFAFIGPEDPLGYGVVDSLSKMGISSVGPVKSLARLETSKSFTRILMKKYKIVGNPRFEIFTKENISNAKNFLDTISQCVVKPDGLTGGKGVKVQGDHFFTKKEALDYCSEVLALHPSVVLEEKFEGEEFSLHCFCDGKTVAAMPAVQDHKRAYDDDKGPNTGGMGSYSCEDHLLPFLEKSDIEAGVEMTKKVAKALYDETGEQYKGVMYAGLIKTKNGVKLVEYNARFGDPETMNLLPILESDLGEISMAIINGELHKTKIKFKNLATVCKYAVPQGYPENPVKNKKIEIGKIPKDSRIYYASVDEQKDGLYMGGSRAVAALGIAKQISEAEILQKRINHMKNLMS